MAERDSDPQSSRHAQDAAYQVSREGSHHRSARYLPSSLKLAVYRADVEISNVPMSNRIPDTYTRPELFRADR
jgi:hypothetical protein